MYAYLYYGNVLPCYIPKRHSVIHALSFRAYNELKKCHSALTQGPVILIPRTTCSKRCLSGQKRIKCIMPLTVNRKKWWNVKGLMIFRAGSKIYIKHKVSLSCSVFNNHIIFKGTVSWDRFQNFWQKFTEQSLNKGRGWFVNFWGLRWFHSAKSVHIYYV